VLQIKKAGRSTQDETSNSETWLAASLDQLHKLRNIAISIRGKKFCQEFLTSNWKIEIEESVGSIDEKQNIFIKELQDKLIACNPYD